MLNAVGNTSTPTAATQAATWSQADYFRTLSHRVTRAEFANTVTAYTNTTEDDALEHAHEMLQMVKRHADALQLDGTAQALLDIYCLLETQLDDSATYEHNELTCRLNDLIACDFAEYIRATPQGGAR